MPKMKNWRNGGRFGTSMWITNSVKSLFLITKGRGGSDNTVSDPIEYRLLLAEGSG